MSALQRVEPGSRSVTLVLCRPDGAVLGALAPFAVELPWWQEVEPVVAAARRHHGVDVTVLRLLAAERPEPHGGAVTYLAEVDGVPPPALVPWDGAIEPDPRRQPWAEPGGPGADLAWADAALKAAGRPRTGAAEQVRTWNLSSLWRLPTGDGTAWLKVVPPFFAHEGEVVARLDPAVAPPLVAAERPRLLLHEIPGEDLFEATLSQLLLMVRSLVAIQVAWTDRLDELAAVGAPDWRPARLAAAVADVLARHAGEVSTATAAAIETLLAGWDARFAAVAGCGIPDSIVHGDFHPGNVRGTGDRITILDWGDSGIGHPLLDQAAFTWRLDPAATAAVRATWAAAWGGAVSGCEPDRAAELLAPVAALRQAVIYRSFLDQIEASEQVYHRADPAAWLARAADA